MQIIQTQKLSEEQNLWLCSLTNKLTEFGMVEKLIEDYGNHKENKLYKSMMNIIVQANKEKFLEVKIMCEALEELMQEELDEREEKGEDNFALLTSKLLENSRTEDLKKATGDKEYRAMLYREFGIVRQKE